MFSTIVSYVAFGLTSLFMMFFLYESTRSLTETEKLMVKLGATFTVQWRNFFIALSIWIASGIYLWG